MGGAVGNGVQTCALPISIVLLVAAVVLDQRLVAFLQRGGDRVGQALQQRAAQPPAVELGLFGRRDAHAGRLRGVRRVGGATLGNGRFMDWCAVRFISTSTVRRDRKSTRLNSST